MSDNQENILPEGIFLKPPHSGAPSWVKGQIGIKVDKAIEWLNQNQNDRGYVNLDLNESKAGKLYLILNVYVSQKPETQEPEEEDPFLS